MIDTRQTTAATAIFLLPHLPTITTILATTIAVLLPQIAATTTNSTHIECSALLTLILDHDSSHNQWHQLTITIHSQWQWQ